MSLRHRFFALLALLAVPACTPPSSGGALDLTEEDQESSYAVGYDFGESVRDGASYIDFDAFIQGVRDGVANEPAVEWEARQVAVQRFIEAIRDGQAERARAAQAADSVFLEENAERAEVTVTESGLQYEVLEEGEGPTLEMGQQARLHYRGTLSDGTEFDSSYQRGEPAVFRVGNLVPGFNEAMTLMSEGSKFKVVIPGDLAYGAQGRPPAIGPNAALIFEIEILEIVE
jgi:FKBP-type peptidyl-prolyl cis-trans isomerase